MRRQEIKPRADWQKKVESHGLTFHTRDAPYWNENACYVFNSREIDSLEKAANDVHEIALVAAQHIIDKNLFSKMAITPYAAELIKKSWNDDELHFYGRFDFLYDGRSNPKMIEYNADTPTSLLEASVVQWYWLKEKYPDADQFNSMHEKLINRWKRLGIKDKIYFSTLADVEEDVLTTEYIRDTAHQAGLDTEYINTEEIGLCNNKFVDLDNNQIKNLFKLYAWESMVDEEFGKYISSSNTRFIEPAWKMLWSNKALLPIMWEIAPNHPNLLESSFDVLEGPHVRKPLFGREGSNVTIYDGFNTLAQTDGHYGEEGFIYQRYHSINDFNGKNPVLGLWMIGDECAGMGIRESDSKVTDNLSQFTPHYFG